MLRPKTRNNISRIIPFGLIWFFFSIVYTLLERGLLGELTQYPATGNPYSFTGTILITPAIALLTGTILGTVEVLSLNKLFIQRTFTQKILYKTFLYLAIIIFFLFTLTVLANAIGLQQSVFSRAAWTNTWAFFSSFAFWSVVIYIAAMTGVSLFYAEVSENLGQGVLLNFFTGRYHTPIEEERIFMFLDMKSSTTHAENMGHVKYFQMLREYFADLTDPILQHSGEIYQYVGDEVVVSWKLRNGLHDNNCINCFLAMKDALQKQRDNYLKNFGVSPEFKGGLHVGKVTTGEIGVIKKEIIFTGDVLNTTARIQGLCNTFQVDILVSEPLAKMLHAPLNWKALGEHGLRGRDEKLILFTIESK
ncbi:adenylate/guanylate cyclase domain-containing protein [Chryseolinea lacunae]|uniref:Adenylate/guanylate cyclase domain-containing protein n=1 Tax=Chryseolinea lacunae TaxID=2801331 RepID=A0ABS1KZU1_9BACT|nr:adenylate/guanylate cyclase domain-containing protein [Chryseolinea lacunae]MBL0744788.1 adenylate/guanylate cyclase domain-containing protein [Chryseolinea lacunae]